MSDKVHKVLSVVLAAIVGVGTLAMTPGVGPAAGHPHVEMWLKFAVAVAGFFGTLFIKPAASGSSTASVTKLTAVALALGLFVGCAGGPIFGRCILKNLKSEEQPAIAQVALAAASQNYTDALLEIAKAAGKPTVYCAARAILADMAATGNPRYAAAEANLRAWVAAMEQSDPGLCCSTDGSSLSVPLK